MYELEIFIENLSITDLTPWASCLCTGIIIFLAIYVPLKIRHDKDKERYDKANTIMHYHNNIYYITAYEYKDACIEAVDIYGNKLILPKECTVITDK